MPIFYPTDILLPRVSDMTAWSVVACDQYTSQREYWDGAEKRVGTEPSALRLMLPEAWLGTERECGAEERITEAMEAYLAGDVFFELKNVFIYLERTQPDGRIRRGLMAALDLEQYDYAPGNTASVRASEATVEERLPPRIRVRERASLEMPHTMVLMDDDTDRVIETARFECAEKVYDFALMQNGGHLRGWAIRGVGAEKVQNAFSALERERALSYVVGDGNHSLAAAKRCWESMRENLPAAERERNAARFSLVELVNIYDPALDFEPIHRVIFDTDTAPFGAAAERSGRKWEDAGLMLSERVAAADRFCRDYIAAHGGHLDYIHGDDTARALGSRPGCAALILPPIGKEGLFRSVAAFGALPRKSFSMGHAADKRYYTECRRIR